VIDNAAHTVHTVPYENASIREVFVSKGS
jgi:hypothetical protein